MKSLLSIAVAFLLYTVFALSSCALQEEAKAPAGPAQTAQAKAKAKAKPVKASGNIGLLDLEKNYMILVTKQGKLITVDFNDKAKVTRLVPGKSKVSEINLGERATVTYRSKGDKKVASSVEFISKAKKGE